MTDKKWTFALLLATIAVAGAFASGDKDDEDWDRSGPPGGGRQGMMADGEGRDRPPRMEDLETESYSGTFTMVDDLYPALITDGGDTWYLMIPIQEAEMEIPEEGAEITVEGAVSRMSPVHLMVVSATVDGEELEMELPDRDDRGDRGSKSGGRSGGNPPGRS